MHVVGDGQPEVSCLPAIAKPTLENVDAWTKKFHDGEREIGEMLGISGAAAREEFAERNVVGSLGKFFADIGRERDDAIPPLGLAHDSSQRRRSALEQVRSDRSIGRDHEILDHVARAIASVDSEIHDLAIHDHRASLDALEVERAGHASRLAESARGLVLHAKSDHPALATPR